MHVTLNGEPLEEVDCFKYLGSQLAADGGSERDERLGELESAEKSAEQLRTGDRGQEVSM